MEEKLRMCVVCRKMHEKRDLIRIVRDKDNNISIDLTGKKNGRGAYVCKEQECLKFLCKHKALNKTFKLNIDDKVYTAIVEGFLDNRST